MWTKMDGRAELAPAGATKPTRTAIAGLVTLLNHLKLGLNHGDNDQLSQSLHGLKAECFLAAVPG